MVTAASLQKASSIDAPKNLLTIAIGIPTRGRPLILKETLADLALQTVHPAMIAVAFWEPTDIGDAPVLFPEVRFLQGSGSGGSCAQRNKLLQAIGTSVDLILIMDDDCYLHRDYLKRTEQVFARDASVVGTTGRILENGANGPGLLGAYARQKLGAIAQVPSLAEAPPRPAFNTDGCNMAFRAAVIAQQGLRFDEAMPGYAWYEDIDFSRRLLPYGTLQHVPGAQAVHLGAKVGKTSGRRYGYSQIANPLYLARKGTYPWPNAVESIAKNLAANLWRSLRPEPYIDRPGRLRGNLLALGHAALGRCRPDRILHL